ncbi:hypothetical protein L6452_37466 [Arctium lappa]|uniref:Uncharacterized protein n=1 Tax=Arctium lappa TaxID=4217 RepID=A0ACB8Y316_ARCLA|nr:hypothetical protein L6452_37466 [Arctium lappa]
MSTEVGLPECIQLSIAGWKNLTWGIAETSLLHYQFKRSAGVIHGIDRAGAVPNQRFQLGLIQGVKGAGAVPSEEVQQGGFQGVKDDGTKQGVQEVKPFVSSSKQGVQSSYAHVAGKPVEKSDKGKRDKAAGGSVGQQETGGALYDSTLEWAGTVLLILCLCNDCSLLVSISNFAKKTRWPFKLNNPLVMKGEFISDVKDVGLEDCGP